MFCKKLASSWKGLENSVIFGQETWEEKAYDQKAGYAVYIAILKASFFKWMQNVKLWMINIVTDFPVSWFMLLFSEEVTHSEGEFGRVKITEHSNRQTGALPHYVSVKTLSLTIIPKASPNLWVTVFLCLRHRTILNSCQTSLITMIQLYLLCVSNDGKYKTAIL